MTPEEKAFQDILDENPEDQITRSVMADYLEERGDPRAMGYRALAKMNKYPLQITTHYAPYFAVCLVFSEYDCTRTHRIPQFWFNCIEHHDARDFLFPNYDCVQTIKTRKEVEDIVALAFNRLPLQKQQELMND